MFSIVICLFIYAQVSAQCGNINNRDKVRADNHIFSGQSFGQSIVIDSACYGGNKFTQFSFSAQGSSSTKFDLKIYAGQTSSGTPRYTQTNISLPAANRGAKLTIDLADGTGDLSFVNGQTYTFILTGREGNLIAHVSNQATSGQAYLKTGFDSTKDLLYEVETGQGPGKLKVYNAAGQGNALYLNEDLKFVNQGDLGQDDEWEFIEVENGYVVIKCPTRGYLVAGAFNNNIYNLGYHQYEKTATRFKVEPGHKGNAEGYKSYRWVTTHPRQANRFLGIWRDRFVIRAGTGEATSLKLN